MLALLVSACLAQEFGPPRLIAPFSGSVGVPVAAGRAAVEAFDGGFLVAWADDRRLTNLARTPITGGEDVWLRVLRPRLLGSATQRARLVCPRAGVTAGPRLAVSSTGLTGLAWSDERGVSLATLDQNGASATGPCGVLVSNIATNLVEVSPRGAGFAVVHSGLGLLQTNVVNSAIAPPTTRFMSGVSSVVSVAGASNTTVIGALTNQVLHVLYEPTQALQVPNVAEFDLVEGTPGPAVALIRDGGLFIGPALAMVGFKDFASSRRPPYAVAIDGGVLVLSTNPVGSGLQLYSTASMTMVQGSIGLPEGLVVTPDEGVALFSAPAGVLGATSVQPAPGFQGASVFVSMAGAIQRRPTLAWSAVDVGWELVWEEATSATTFGARHTLIRLQGDGGASGQLFIDGGSWPRVFPQFDGGLGYMALEGQVTTFSLSTGAGIVPVDQLDASVEGVAAGEPGGLVWTGPSTPSGLHQEFTLRTAELPLEAFLPDEVTCATWFEGSYFVTRRGDAGATLAVFPDDTTPVAGMAIPQGQLACVAARLTGSPALALAVADGLGLKVSTLDAGWRVPFDAGVRDLQLTSVGGRWLVVWDTEDALHAALFSPTEGARVLESIDLRPQAFRGVPSLATSPIGAAAVAWPVLEGDSVELRVRVLSLANVAPVLDGGVVDAGVGLVDAGVVLVDGGVVLVDAGVADAGVVFVDGGSADGGVPTVTFVPVCGCTSVSDELWWLVALLVLRKRRAPVMQ